MIIMIWFAGNDYNDGLCEIEAVKMRDNIRSKRNCINKTGSERTNDNIMVKVNEEGDTCITHIMRNR